MKRIVGLVVLVALAVAFAAMVRVSHPAFTCVVCRATRVDFRALGLTRSRTFETDCSRWYAAHVEPTHSHVWERSPKTISENLLGRSQREETASEPEPIWALDPSTQEAVYRKFAKPIEAKALFESLASRDALGVERGGVGDERRRLTARAIKEWLAAGFPGTWADWRMRYDAFLAEEVGVREEWKKSKSELSFEEWRSRKERAPVTSGPGEGGSPSRKPPG